MPHFINFKFPKFWVNINEDDRFLQTVFEDGTFAPARPNYDDEHLEMARSLGYLTTCHVCGVMGLSRHQEICSVGAPMVDVWAMTKDHELAHSWLAIQDGKDWSPTLWMVAHDKLSIEAQAGVDREEARVLEFQRALVKDLLRPWDVFFDRGLGDLIGH